MAIYSAGLVNSNISDNAVIKTMLGNHIDYHSITKRLGIHYYLGRHQFECLLSLEPVVSGKNNFLTESNGAYKLIHANSFYYNFNLNYTYRF